MPRRHFQDSITGHFGNMRDSAKGGISSQK
jgi:hypothetical protein